MAAELRVDYNDYFEANYQSAVKAEPKAEPQKKQKSVDRVKREKITPEESRRHTRILLLRAVAIVSAISLFAINCAAYATFGSKQHEIAQLEAQLQLKQSEYAQYDAQLMALVSPEQVEKIAVEQLGLVKLNDSDWQYINVDSGNEIIVSQGNNGDK